VPINSVAERSNTPTSKFVVVSIAPAVDTDVAVQEVRASAERL